MESTERFECPQIRLLNDILRIVFIAKEPSSQIVGCIKMRQQRFFKRGQLRFLSVILFALLEYRELHNVPTRFEIFGLGNMLRFQWQSHSDFRGIITSGHTVHSNATIYLTRLALDHFIPFKQQKNSVRKPDHLRHIGKSNNAAHNSSGIKIHWIGMNGLYAAQPSYETNISEMFLCLLQSPVS